MVVLVGIVATGVAVVAYFFLVGTEPGRRLLARAQTGKVRKLDRQLNDPSVTRVDALISEVGRRPDGTLACAKCGGAQFKARRSTGRRFSIGALAATFGLLAAAPAVGIGRDRVECVTCGAVYHRG